jgi:hypothetical protein
MKLVLFAYWLRLTRALSYPILIQPSSIFKPLGNTTLVPLATALLVVPTTMLSNTNSPIATVAPVLNPVYILPSFFDLVEKIAHSAPVCVFGVLDNFFIMNDGYPFPLSGRPGGLIVVVVALQYI